MIRIEKIVSGHFSEVSHKTHTFSGGEEHVAISGTIFGADSIRITASLRNSSEVLKLLLLKGALDTMMTLSPIPITLILTYLPYARQDRVCNEGEAHSLRVMCRLINNMKFEVVTLHDPHSIVSEALLDNCRVIDQTDLLHIPSMFPNEALTLVAPDAGSEKKTESLAKTLLVFEKAVTLESASKIRDLSTREILRTQYNGNAESITNKDVYIVDDICDGGRTFIELAKVLRVHNPATLTLIVTNGIFSYGREVVEEYFDKVIAIYDWTEDV